MGDIAGVEGLVELNVIQIRFCQTLPDSIVIFLFGKKRDLAFVEGFAGLYRDLLCPAVGMDKAECDPPEDIGEIFLQEEGFRFHGFCNACIADAVNGTGILCRAQVVVSGNGGFLLLILFMLGLFPVAQDGTPVFRALRQPDHGKIIRCDGGAACNSGHKGIAENLTFGVAAADKAGAVAGNTACIVSLAAVDQGGVGAVFHKTHALPAADAAGILFTCGDGADVFTAADHSADFAVDIQGFFAVLLPVLPDIQIVFHGNGAGDAADIQICQDRPFVDTALCLAA